MGGKDGGGVVASFLKAPSAMSPVDKT